MLRFLRERAGWFVLAGWALLPLTILWAIGESVTAAINAFYHPHHRGAPLDRFIIQAVYIVPVISLAAAVASSLLFTLKLRLAASVAVVGGYSVLFVGVTGARLVVKPGPEHFERYVGTERFSVPWQYAPRGEGRPISGGFYVVICPSNLRGTYDKLCRDPQRQQFSIYPSDTGFDRIFHVGFWRSRLSEMKIGEVRHGHQSYSYTFTSPAGGRRATTEYLARYDQEGKLTRLVVCYSPRSCLHARVRNYVLSYPAEGSALSEWQTMDRKLADLVDSWRVR
jgi:hypothetical protein